MFNISLDDPLFHFAHYRRDRSSYTDLWYKLLIDAKIKARTSTNMSEIFSKNVCTRLNEMAEDVARISRTVSHVN